MFAEVVSASAPTSVAAAGGLDCHLMSGCGFPAPGAESYLFEDSFTLQVASLECGFSKVTVLLLLGVVAVVGFFTAFRPKLVPRGAGTSASGYVFVRDGIIKRPSGTEARNSSRSCSASSSSCGS